MVAWRRRRRRLLLRVSNRSFLAFVVFFSMFTTCLYFIYAAPGIANTYFFMVQAQGIMLRDNVRTIGHMIRLYTNKNTTLNGTDYPDGSNSSELLIQPTTFLPENFTYAQNLPCPERLPSMKGPIDVAVLIPFRNRHEHLPILFQHLTPMLQRQRLHFSYYVIEQTGSHPFNRAMLFNVGFMEAMKDLAWDCLVFHDVDHIPENDRNYYGCGQMPRHFAAKLDKYMYILPYSEFFGGVSGLTVEQFSKINGFPNAFWGWGGEDDDLWNRGEVQFLGRYKLLRYSKERQHLDGLNNLRYTPHVSLHGLYKNITVDLQPELAPIADY
ncbi:hypothetical protein NHX12_033542 [Muraenolepis orangiensis]|uniref:Beta-1,4-galactosyltransferase n=1 Tax=Muraenolepis orangiensis TaxID=630683 RepID=A0A9Q0E3K8_9TELE|nr:hypothetical protein NHX12_033542 [Muraenolepis orangiensis]